MNFIKKIFDGEVDDLVHSQFQKFSRGEFRDRAVIEAKQSKGKFTIKTAAEFANGMVRKVAGLLGDEKALVKGAVVSTSDLTGELDFIGKKQFQGVKRYLIESEMSGSDILNLLDKFPKAFFALSFETGDTKLKIKPKAPKSGKPGKGDASPKADFCRLVTKNKELGGSYVFEKPDFKKADITHHYFIDEIVKPEGETDFAKIRELGKRKGRVVREAVIDEQPSKSEKEFSA